MGRFVSADSIFITSSFLGYNLFSYCENTPVTSIDSNGYCKKILFIKFDCHKVTCKTSKNYKSTRKKAAVLYDGRSSGSFFGLIDGQGFEKQGESLVEELQSSYEVDAISFDTLGGVVDGWNSLNDTYDRVYILAHGDPGNLWCEGENLGVDQNSSYSIWDLSAIDTKNIYLYSCNGATLNQDGISLANAFSDITGACVTAVSNGSVNYNILTNKPYADGGVWVSRTRKNYIFK